MRLLRMSVAALVAAWMLTVSATQAPADTRPAHNPEGIWQGTLQGVLRIMVHIQRGGDGRLTGTMDSPDQGATGLAIDAITFGGDSLRFEMHRIGGRYAGVMSADGAAINGEWSQGGGSVPLTLGRTDKVPEVRRPQDPARPYPYDEDTVRVMNRRAGVSLAGTLTKPKGAGPFPAVVLVTGSGPEDRDEAIFGHRPFLVLADHLTRHGIAVLRLDDRGVGASSGRFAGATSEDFAGDILAAIEFLKSRPAIDAKHIGLIGHSEGGMIAPIVATRSPNVAFIVLMAGTGLPGDSLLLLQSAALLHASGVDDSAIASQRAAMRRVLTLVRQGADSAAVYKAAREMVETQLAVVPPEQRGNLGNPDSLAMGATHAYLSPWLRFFIGFDPRPTLARVRVPVLAINGGSDLQVPPKENLAAIKAALERGGNRDATVKELPGLNHLFQHCSACTIAEYGRLDETIAPEALEEISGWITAHTNAKR